LQESKTVDLPSFPFQTIPQLLEKLNEYPRPFWIYRGQADSEWLLAPKAGRQEYHIERSEDTGNSDLPDVDLRRFKQWRSLAVAYKKDLPSNDFECLGFAQHYGLATRLLDWSLNPLVALFFAVDSESDMDAAVYAYSPNWHVRPDAGDLSSSRLISQYTPPPFDSRILVQSGVFTYHPEPTKPLTAERLGAADLGKLTPDHKSNLVRFVLPKAIKGILKRKLSELGVSRKSMFPDLDGLSDFVNWETRNTVTRKKKYGVG